MATADIPKPSADQNRILHGAIVGTIVAVVVFLACWLLTFTPLTATHALIALFTAAPITSTAALVQGLCGSLVFGAWVGFLIAAVSKLVARTSSRE